MTATNKEGQHLNRRKLTVVNNTADAISLVDGAEIIVNVERCDDDCVTEHGTPITATLINDISAKITTNEDAIAKMEEEKASITGKYASLSATMINVPATSDILLQPLNTVMQLSGSTLGYPANSGSWGISFRWGTGGMNIIMYVPSLAANHNLYYKMVANGISYNWRKISSSSI